MNARIVGATVGRILRQLRHDPRTIGLILVVPLVLMTLVYYMLDAQEPVASRMVLTMLGIFGFIIMFLITSIAMLRERTSGTLERVLAGPTGKLDLLFGYGLAFGLLAAIQATVTSGFAYAVLDLQTQGPAGLVVLVAVINSLLGVGFGLLVSAFARSEFQAVQFFPAVVLPQLLLCGLFVARDQMAGWMETLSNFMPVTYAADALNQIGENAAATADYWKDLGIIAGCIVLALVLAAATLRRRTE